MNSVKCWEQLRRMGIQSDLHTLVGRGHCFQRTASPETGQLHLDGAHLGIHEPQRVQQSDLGIIGAGGMAVSLAIPVHTEKITRFGP